MTEKQIQMLLRALKLVDIRKKYGLTRSDIIKYGHLNRITVYTWEAGTRKFPEFVPVFYELLGEKYGVVQRVSDQSGQDHNDAEQI